MSVCLAMICRNESALIRTALASVKSLIDRWVVVDTGSTDGTQNIVMEEMRGIPGTLFERPWVNWAHNRTEVINLAKLSGTDFVFILDADEKVIVPANFKLSLDPKLAYWVNIKYGPITYSRPNILSVKYNWHYVGVTHEYLTPTPDNPPIVTLPILLETNSTRTNKTPEKCALDAQLLEKGLINEPENSRYVFYLAQSYRDCGKLEKAVENYERRATLGGWHEEVWYSLFQVAELIARLEYPETEVVSAYLNAYEANPLRSESLGALARYLRLRNKYNLAFQFAAIAKATPRPNEKLFIDDTYYNWRNLDEYAVAAFWTGHFRECVQACDELINSGKLPPYELARVIKNKNFAISKLSVPSPDISDTNPLVSAVMLTRDRMRYIPQAVDCFLKQTYTNSELIIVDDGTESIRHLIPGNPRISYNHLDEVKMIGTKRNIACALAKGKVIINWDDDDWSHPYRMAQQVQQLLSSGRQLTGYNKLLYWNEPDGKTYKFVCEAPYAAGSSQCFWKIWWEQHPYPEIHSGEDRVMSAAASGAGQLDCHDGGQMLVARAHEGNTWKPTLGIGMFPACDPVDFPPEFFAAIGLSSDKD